MAKRLLMAALLAAGLTAAQAATTNWLWLDDAVLRDVSGTAAQANTLADGSDPLLPASASASFGPASADSGAAADASAFAYRDGVFAYLDARSTSAGDDLLVGVHESLLADAALPRSYSAQTSWSATLYNAAAAPARYALGADFFITQDAGFTSFATLVVGGVSHALADGWTELDLGWLAPGQAIDVRFEAGASGARVDTSGLDYVGASVRGALFYAVSPVPEPSRWTLLVAGLLFVGVVAHRRARV